MQECVLSLQLSGNLPTFAAVIRPLSARFGRHRDAQPGDFVQVAVQWRQSFAFGKAQRRAPRIHLFDYACHSGRIGRVWQRFLTAHALRVPIQRTSINEKGIAKCLSSSAWEDACHHNLQVSCPSPMDGAWVRPSFLLSQTGSRPDSRAQRGRYPIGGASSRPHLRHYPRPCVACSR